MLGVIEHTMSWVRKDPFGCDEDPIRHMVVLLAVAAENAGIPITDDDKRILCKESRRGEPLPDELREKAKKLIEQILKKDCESVATEDTKSFGNSLEWAGDRDYPNIVALTEEVIMSGAYVRNLPRLHGWAWVKERIQVVGFGLLIVLLMFLVIGIVTIVSRHK